MVIFKSTFTSMQPQDEKPEKVRSRDKNGDKKEAVQVEASGLQCLTKDRMQKGRGIKEILEAGRKCVKLFSA